ncbi:methyl-accepting chemotaxis protein [Carboxydothermus islandicus]|uniref:Methyl-accepting chemotaxis protein n=1 Tax=Carboxydothermus islandicus TaxID=661089 RepID=A0A1L8D543_9THEO|nr:methyl-accepting chemotaxis protein [Carboxydothermus islandicus]GAV26191.1 methyl-accepting chemotaxis protein [Carboxydothermus islandicus]
MFRYFAKEKENKDMVRRDLTLELRDSLSILKKQIEKVINLSEAAVLEMGQAAENSMNMIKNSKELITASLQEVLELNRASIAAISNVVEENARVLQEVEAYLHQLIIKIDGVFRLWGKEGQEQLVALLENVTRKTRVVALNASIEAARLGAAGRSFAVVAQEIQNLVGKTSEAIENLAEHNRVFEQKVEELAQNLEELEGYFLMQLRAANEKIARSGKISQEWGQKTKEIFQKADQALENLEEVITRGAANFQFQDIIAQRLNNVIKGLKLIEEYLKNKGEGELLRKIEMLYTSEDERTIHRTTLNNSQEKDAELLNNVEFF